MLDHEETRGQHEPPDDVDDGQVPVVGMVELEKECYGVQGWWVELIVNTYDILTLV